MNPTARCWVQVDLGTIEQNLRAARRRLLPGTALIAVLKCDAYGLGAVPIARFLRGLGQRFFAVATVEEALQIKAHLDAQVLVMGMAGLNARDAIQGDVILTAYDAVSAADFNKTALKMGKPCRVHIKVNTGLNRLGFDPDDLDAIEAAMRLPGLQVEGMFTHLGLHGEGSDRAQFERFDRVLDRVKPPLAHALDSIGLVRYPDRQYGGVRLGAWLYGVHPKDVPEGEDPLAASFYARVAQVFTVGAGQLMGYDDHKPLARTTRVATLACGYGDGYPRCAGYVALGGRLAPVLGLVCMDQMMVDVTDCPLVQPGDVATLLGGPVSIDQYAGWSGLNRNEALCRVGRRVPRLYCRDGRQIDEREGICHEGS